jgi:hypothetical protein
LQCMLSLQHPVATHLQNPIFNLSRNSAFLYFHGIQKELFYRFFCPNRGVC